MTKKSVPIYIGLILSISALAITGCGGEKPAMLQLQTGSGAQSGQEKGNVLSFTGKTSGIEEVQIFSKVSGRVANVTKDIGDTVNAGDPLVILETSDLQAQLDSSKSDLALAQAKYNEVVKGSRDEDIRAAQAAYDAALQKYLDTKNGTRPEQLDKLKANVANTQTNYENAKSQYDKNKTLYDQGVISKQALDNSEVAYQQAEALYIAAKDDLQLAVEGPTQETLNALKAAADQAKAVLDKTKNGATPEQIQEAEASVQKAQALVGLNQYTFDNGTIKSPIKGYIAAKSINPGELANPSTPLMTVVNIDKIFVSIDVPEDQLKYLKLNQDVDVQIDALGKTLKGKIAIISPAAEQGSDKYLVKVLLDNPDHSLRSGMTGLVKIKY